MTRYNIVSTDQFDETWRRAICAGVVDPEAGEAKLRALAEFLAIDPRYFDLFDAPGEIVDLRWVNFLLTDMVRVQIWYSVVEDDRRVYLESVEIIRRSQQSFPGFDV